MKKLLIFTAITLTPFLASGAPEPSERYSTALGTISAINADLEKDRKEARDQHDAIRFVCIEDKLHSVSAALRQVSNRQQFLDTALQTGDKEGAAHEALIAEEILKRVQTLSDEAKLCAGAKLSKSDDSETVNMTVDDSITPVEATPPTTNLITEPPACASCFR